jgi:hypothetical protein
MGMQVYAYTFGNDLSGLKWDYRGDVRNELNYFMDTIGLDAYFTDYPNTARSFLDSSDCQRSNQDTSKMTITSLVILVFMIIIVYGSILPPFSNNRAAIVGCHGRQ